MAESSSTATENMSATSMSRISGLGSTRTDVTSLLSRVLQVAAGLHRMPQKKLEPSQAVHLDRAIGTVERLLHTVLPLSEITVGPSVLALVEQAFGGATNVVSKTSPLTDERFTASQTDEDPKTEFEILTSSATVLETSPAPAIQHVATEIDKLTKEMEHRREETEHLQKLFERFRKEKDTRITRLEKDMIYLMNQFLEFDEQNKTELRYLRNKVTVLEELIKEEHLSEPFSNDLVKPPLQSAGGQFEPPHAFGDPVPSGFPHMDIIGIPPRSTSLYGVTNPAGLGNPDLFSPGHQDHLFSPSHTLSNRFDIFNRSAARIENSLNDRHRRQLDGFRNTVAEEGL